MLVAIAANSDARQIVRCIAFTLLGVFASLVVCPVSRGDGVHYIYHAVVGAIAGGLVSIAYTAYNGRASKYNDHPSNSVDTNTLL
jgi:hypothetical protein